jgi:hypothetical protein
VPATAVTIESPTRMTAVTGQSAAGTVDVVVSSLGRTATLPRSFTYSAPTLAENTPPVIVSIRALGTRPNEPEQFPPTSMKRSTHGFVQDAESPNLSAELQWAPGMPVALSLWGWSGGAVARAE